jgi:hypothetical protein|tara:strand:+ start:4342 stop:4935 length:594 start_codon:yes stop_codon:yes gene_type:complete
MEKNIPQNLEKVLFDKPIAGQSLTNSPENKYAWEQAPKYTSVKDAREAIFLNLLEPQTLKSVQELMMTDVSVNAIAEVVLTDGFRKGKFNPDMMLNLLEPTMYMLMAIAEKSGIEPMVDGEGPEEDDEDVVQEVVKERNNSIKEGGGFRDAKIKTIQPTSVGNDIKSKLEKLNIDKVKQSILQKPEPSGSLLGKVGV